MMMLTTQGRVQPRGGRAIAQAWLGRGRALSGVRWRAGGQPAPRGTG